MSKELQKMYEVQHKLNRVKLEELKVKEEGNYTDLTKMYYLGIDYALMQINNAIKEIERDSI